MTDPRAVAARRAIRAIGAAQAILLALYALASPFITFAAFHESGWRNRPESLGRFTGPLTMPGEVLTSASSGLGMDFKLISEVGYIALVAMSVVLWLVAIVTVYRFRDVLETPAVDSIFRWSLVFAGVLIFAAPILVHDFWLSIGWGRVLADGSNPYYVLPASFADLPVTRHSGLMTYGPFWAIVAGALAAIGFGNVIAIAVLQKLVLAGAFVVTMWTIRALTRHQSAAGQCMALVVFGWAPLVLLQAIADGHNDIVLLMLALQWQLRSERGQHFTSAVALAASIALKYVTAPLLALHVLRGLLQRGRERRLWLASAGAAVLTVVVIVGLFYRSPDFFEPARVMRTWTFFTPSSIVLDIAEPRLGWPRSASRVIDAALIIVALSFAAHSVWRCRIDGLRHAALWLVSGILLGSLGHVWPWFVIWPLGFAVIQLSSRVAWFVVGLSVAAPFLLVLWRLNPDLAPLYRITLPGLILYGAGVIGFIAGGKLVTADRL